MVFMKTTKGRSELLIPVVDPKKQTKLVLEDDEVMKWRASLPMANTGAAAKEVFFALSELIQSPMNYEKRFQLIELFRPPLQWICQVLRKHYINNSKPLTEQQIRIANLGQNLQTHMVLGYKLVIDDCLKNPPKEVQKSVLPMTIYRVMHYYTLILLRCYQLSSP
jgi:cyclic-di-GMP-binding protein